MQKRSADNTHALYFPPVEIFDLHLLEFEFQPEFFNSSLVEISGDTFNVGFQPVQFSFQLFIIVLEILR
jgi:hypothetical protein